MRALIAIGLTLAACGGAPTPGTRRHDMSVDEHMKLASQHAAEASAVAGTGAGTASGSPSYPWYYFWDPQSEHVQLERAHARAGVELELEVREACAGIPDTARRSPLADAASLEQNDRWVVFHFRSDTLAPDRLLAELRCWRTRMMLSRRSAADATCLEDVVWTAHAGAGGVDLMATTSDRARAAELVRRAAEEVR